MPPPCPHHCPPEGGGSLAAAGGLLVLGVIVAAVARPVIHAAEVALEIIVITAGCLASVALVSVAAVVAVRLRHRQLAARPPVRLVSSRSVPSISAARPPVIGPARVVPPPWSGKADNAAETADRAPGWPRRPAPP